MLSVTSCELDRLDKHRARKTCERSSAHAKLYIVQLSNYVKTTIIVHLI